MSAWAAGRRAHTPALAPVSSDGAFAIDAGAIAVVTAGILAFAHDLPVMSVLVPAVLVLRFALHARLPRAERVLSLGREALLFAGLTLFGAFNDWNSVCNHRIYDYLVPADHPELSTIPSWMLLYWGLILRFVLTLARYRRLSPPAAPRDDVWLGPLARRSNGGDGAARGYVRSPALKIGIQIALVLATRQLIYRLYDHAIFSWLPFAVALALYGLLFRPRRYELVLALLFLLAGPVVEIAYIGVGLHRYALGWLGGVPVWIALWWVLGMLVLADLATRILRRLAGRAAATAPGLALR